MSFSHALTQIDSVALEQAVVVAEMDVTLLKETLENILLKDGRINLKNSGPSNIASISLRGGNSSQVQVSWNGVELNSPMLGQIDINLLNPVLFDEIHLNSSIRSFSGITGELNFISNNSGIGIKEFNYEIGFRTKSFNSSEAYFQTKLSNKKSLFTIKAYNQWAKNNFYFPSLENVKQNQHADLKRKGVLLSHHIKTKNRAEFSVHLWAQDSFNEIPPTVVQNNSTAVQTDKFLRVQVHSKFKIKEIEAQTVGAFSINQNGFKDPLYLIDSENPYSRTFGRISLSKKRKHWSPKMEFSAEYVRANSENYREIKNRFVLNSVGYITRTSEKSSFNLNLKTSLINQEILIGYQAFIDFKLLKSVKAFGGISRTFRIPTFNDLYWIPGGNLELKPELADAQELGVSGTFKKNKFRTTPKMTFYHRFTQNWILWSFQPQNSFWSADNINEVRSAGIEVNLPLEIVLENGSRLKSKLGGQFISSVFLEALNLPAISEGDAVYYVPNNSYQVNVEYQNKAWSAFSTYNYVGKQAGVVYTLDDFHLFSAGVSKSFKVYENTLEFRLTAQNLSNTRYEMVEYRPLPGRHYTLEINLKSK